MSESLQFSQPQVLWALIAVPLFVWWRTRLLRRDLVPHAPLQLHKLPRLRSTAVGLAALARSAAEVLVLAAAIVALAGPHRATELELMDGEGVDVLLVLDVSLSMLAEDFPPTRLAALQRIAGDFVARSGPNRIGVLVFAKDVFVQTPLTSDHRILRELLDGISVDAINQTSSGGTAVGDALLVAAERLAAARVEGRGQALVLITDGESNSGIDPVLAARWVAEKEIRLYSIGIGGEEPVEVYYEGERVGGPDDPYFAFLDDSQLRAIAEVADGAYYRATDADALEQVFAQLSRLESAPLEVRTLEIHSFLTSWLALAALPLFAAGMVLGGTVLRRPLR